MSKKSKYTQGQPTGVATLEGIAESRGQDWMDVIRQKEREASLIQTPPIDTTPNTTALLGMLAELRFCRDSRLYLIDGSHTFREWCMKQFGEKIGGWVDENL